jgi:dTDP-4-dehydrorhamnose reductase
VRVLLLGAGGMLGHDLLATAPDGVDVVPLARRDLDITDYGGVERAVRDVRPDVIVNAAAYTGVDRAEAEPELAMRVNGEAVGELGRVAKAAGARMVHFSSDYVFDGTAERPYREDDPPHPVNAYGASKLAGETALRASGTEALIIRTQWLFGAHGRSFPRTMWERAARREPTRVVNDQFGRPTYTLDLATATWQLVGSGEGGLVHVANGGVASWFQVAREVFRHAGCSDLVQPCTTAEYPTPARRPRYSVLDTAAFERGIGAALPHWCDAVARFLAQLGTLPVP